MSAASRPFALRLPALCLLLGGLLPAAALAQETASSPGLDQAQALRASQAVLGHAIGDYTLLDREEQPVRLASYRGKPLLVSFIYTGCFQVCPATTRSLQKTVVALQKTFGSGQFNVLSIGFNQPADSPQALKAFAAQHRIDQADWNFLSPPARIVEPLTRDFGFVYQATPAGFDHVLQVTLLDAQGRIVRQIYGSDMAAAELGEPIKMLLRGTPVVAPTLQLDDLINRVRLLCTVYDPRTGGYRVDYSLAIEVAGGATFFVVMVVFLLGEWRARRSMRAKARHG